MTRYLHTVYRITNPDGSRAFYEALGLEFRRELPIVRDGELEATNYFFGVPGQDEELELTFNQDGRSYELGTGYGHIAIGVDDLGERRFSGCRPRRARRRDDNVTGDSGPGLQARERRPGDCRRRDPHVRASEQRSRSVLGRKRLRPTRRPDDDQPLEARQRDRSRCSALRRPKCEGQDASGCEAGDRRGALLHRQDRARVLADQQDGSCDRAIPETGSEAEAGREGQPRGQPRQKIDGALVGGNESARRRGHVPGRSRALPPPSRLPLYVGRPARPAARRTERSPQSPPQEE
jgi:lactoylglutathione lyase